MTETPKIPGAADLRYLLRRKDFRLDVELQIPLHGITGLFGKSGSGKTTLLRCIAGLEKPESGRLIVNGETWEDTANDLSLAIHEREIGYVFQEPRLFDHLTVEKNLEYGEQRKKAVDHGERASIIELLGLTGLLSRKPAELSGGEAQRVAIGRALLGCPRFVLMDEPLASLDRKRREEILPFLDLLHSEQTIPILYVSHNIDEIHWLCDNLIVIDDGRIVAAGNIQSVLTNYEIPLLAGEDAASVIEGTVSSYDAEYDLTRFSFASGALWVTGRHQKPGALMRLKIRANDVSICRTQPVDSTILNILPVTVKKIHSEGGAFALVLLETGNHYLTARITRRSCTELGISVGDEVLVQIKSVAVRHI